MRIYLYLVLIAFIGILGCNRPEQEQAKHSTGGQDQAALQSAQQEIRGLQEQVEQLRSDNQRLRSENSYLSKQNEIMNPRLQQLIAWYGTGIWDYREESNSPVFVKSLKGADIQHVIAELNANFQKNRQPELILEKKEGKTVYVSVHNDEQLGERMGSSGALSYMASVAFSLVSVSGIECVFFDIGESEHASPGKYCKNSLEPLMPQ